MKLIILSIISMGLFLSCGNGKKLPNIGDKVYVAQECLSAVSEDDFPSIFRNSHPAVFTVQIIRKEHFSLA